METLRKDMATMGFCWLDKDGRMVRSQKGVIRTNCVDCLDRTNLVQVKKFILIIYKILYIRALFHKLFV